MCNIHKTYLLCGFLVEILIDFKAQDFIFPTKAKKKNTLNKNAWLFYHMAEVESLLRKAIISLCTDNTDQ